jgi:hypothetical protein
MATKEEKLALYKAENKKLGLGLSDELIEKVTTALGPVIYNTDTELVSCSDKKELETVKKSFLSKKIQVPNDDEKYNAAIKKVCEKMGSSNRSKYRALFYALLTVEFGKESIYA